MFLIGARNTEFPLKKCITRHSDRNSTGPSIWPDRNSFFELASAFSPIRDLSLFWTIPALILALSGPPVITWYCVDTSGCFFASSACWEDSLVAPSDMLIVLAHCSLSSGMCPFLTLSAAVYCFANVFKFWKLCAYLCIFIPFIYLFRATLMAVLDIVALMCQLLPIVHCYHQHWEFCPIPHTTE
jgi:hypothetical protein